MHRALALTAAALLAGCGPTDDVGVFAGSCAYGTPQTVQCIDYGDGFGGGGFAITHVEPLCSPLGVPCPSANRLAHCTTWSKLDPLTADYSTNGPTYKTRNNWYANPNQSNADIIATAKSLCTSTANGLQFWFFEP